MLSFPLLSVKSRRIPETSQARGHTGSYPVMMLTKVSWGVKAGDQSAETELAPRSLAASHGIARRTIA